MVAQWAGWTDWGNLMGKGLKNSLLLPRAMWEKKVTKNLIWDVIYILLLSLGASPLILPCFELSIKLIQWEVEEETLVSKKPIWHPACEPPASLLKHVLSLHRQQKGDNMHLHPKCLPHSGTGNHSEAAFSLKIPMFVIFFYELLWRNVLCPPHTPVEDQTKGAHTTRAARRALDALCTFSCRLSQRLRVHSLRKGGGKKAR